MEKYFYRAKVVKVYDWDTVTLNVELWFNIEYNDQVFRLWGIDTPEMRWAEKVFWKEVRDFVREKILKKEILIKTYRDKKWKYWRYLAEIFYFENEKYINLNKELVEKKFAKEYYKWKLDFTVL